MQESSTRQLKTHANGVSTPRQRLNARTAQITSAQWVQMVLFARVTIRIVADTPTLISSNTKPAAPAGKIEKSLCT
jgi:hypothetical protein